MNINNEDILKFKTYIKNHVYIVNLLGKKLLKRSLQDHDSDKQNAKGKTLETFAKRNAKYNKRANLSKEEISEINKLVGKHVKINKHHPEYWDDSIKADEYDEKNLPVVHAEKMSKEAIDEMCCDWAAVSLKLNKPMSDWYNKAIDNRFIFTKKQKEIIKNNLKKLEDIIRKENIKFPNGEKYTANKSSFKEHKKGTKKMLIRDILRENTNRKVAAITFGRMNPMTTGHMLVIKKLSELNADSKFVYLSHSQDKPNSKNPLKCKNPLPYNVKYLYVDAFIKDSPYHDVQLINSEARTILEAIHEVYLKGFTDIIVMVGSDRVNEFSTLANKYNGYSKEGEEPSYKFNTIQVISAGERDENSNNSIEAMSASKLRQLAVEGNFEEFRKGVPTTINDFAKNLYDDVRYCMGFHYED